VNRPRIEGVVRCVAPAKLNLYLHVLGRRADGYHLLDSLVAFASTHDTLIAEPADQLSLAFDGPFGPALARDGAENLVLKAARRLAAQAGRAPSARLTLIKRLPLASGIGGGSADAAAALRALIALWDINVEPTQLASLALSLGADVPVCLQGRAAYFGGIGEDIAPAPPLPEIGLLLVNPGLELATATVFKARAGGFSSPGRLSRAPSDAADLAHQLAARRNDLEAPAHSIAPVIGRVLEALSGLDGCLLARMSGSGATCFGLFADEARARQAARHLAAAEPGWWIEAGRLIADSRQMTPD
jgi:4-diphosphocytidyl-2-C-methyl-D-erythritol kinase